MPIVEAFHHFVHGESTFVCGFVAIAIRATFIGGGAVVSGRSKLAITNNFILLRIIGLLTCCSLRVIATTGCFVGLAGRRVFA